MPSTRSKLKGKKTKLALKRESISDHPAAIGNYEEGSFYQIPIEEIAPDPNQPRKYFDETALGELAESVKRKGVLQPVIIRRDEQGNVYLVAGERRFRAAKMAGLDKIPAILTKGNPMEIALIENLQRENLKPIEEAEALARMVEEHNYTHEQLAFVIGKARSTITETLSLNRLPETIKQECRRADNYPRRLLVEIAKKKTEQEMLNLFEQVQAGNLKSEQVREIARKKPKSPHRSSVALTFEKINVLTKQIKKLNIETLEETERGRILTELQKLKAIIEQILN